MFDLTRQLARPAPKTGRCSQPPTPLCGFALLVLELLPADVRQTLTGDPFSVVLGSSAELVLVTVSDGSRRELWWSATYVRTTVENMSDNLDPNLLVRFTEVARALASAEQVGDGRQLRAVEARSGERIWLEESHAARESRGLPRAHFDYELTRLDLDGLESAGLVRVDPSSTGNAEWAGLISLAGDGRKLEG